jgi:hypothetical protein
MLLSPSSGPIKCDYLHLILLPLSLLTTAIFHDVLDCDLWFMWSIRSSESLRRSSWYKVCQLVEHLMVSTICPYHKYVFKLHSGIVNFVRRSCFSIRSLSIPCVAKALFFLVCNGNLIPSHTNIRRLTPFPIATHLCILKGYCTTPSPTCIYELI